MKANNKILALICAILMIFGISIAPTTAHADSNVMHGIDVSSWQAGMDCGSIPGDFVIIKATEGVSYTYGGMHSCADAALAAGKKIGFYHFTYNSNSAVAEAQHFWSAVSAYRGRAIFVLDNETNTSSAWALEWLKTVRSYSGVLPIIYQSAGTVGYMNSVAAENYGLWIAGYYHGYTPVYGYAPYSLPYSTGSWQNVAIFQYTSTGRLSGWNGNLDLNVFYGSRSTWDAYARSSSGSTISVMPTVPTTPAVPKTVIRPTTSCVVVRSGDTLSSIALAHGGSVSQWSVPSGNPDLIYTGQTVCRKTYSQTVVANGYGAIMYTVRSGDTLSSIASAHGTTYTALAAINGIRNPDLIYPGQVLRMSGSTHVSTTYAHICVVVRSGDTMSAIALAHGGSVSQWSVPSGNPNIIYTGQTVCR